MQRLARGDELRNVKVTLGQIDRGVQHEEGADSDVWHLLLGPAIAALKLRAPGLDPSERVLETREERAEAEEREQARRLRRPRPYPRRGGPG